MMDGMISALFGFVDVSKAFFSGDTQASFAKFIINIIAEPNVAEHLISSCNPQLISPFDLNVLWLSHLDIRMLPTCPLLLITESRRIWVSHASSIQRAPADALEKEKKLGTGSMQMLKVWSFNPSFPLLKDPHRVPYFPLRCLQRAP